RLRLAERLGPRRPGGTQDCSQCPHQLAKEVVLHVRRAADKFRVAEELDMWEEPTVSRLLEPDPEALDARFGAVGPQWPECPRRHCHPPPVPPQPLPWVRLGRCLRLWRRRRFLPFSHG